jgi:hypothetical protein
VYYTRLNRRGFSVPTVLQVRICALSSQYDAVASGHIHNLWAEHMPERPGLACDIGAGSGRDANWLAGKGWDVIAIEPSGSMRQCGARNSHPNVTCGSRPPGQVSHSISFDVLSISVILSIS